MPRPKMYGNSAERSRAWRERRAEELRSSLVNRLKSADDQTLDRLVRMAPMPALMRLHRALDMAEHPELDQEHEHAHRRHRHGHHHHLHHAGHFGRRHGWGAEEAIPADPAGGPVEPEAE
jgi:hypothetical protein